MNLNIPVPVTLAMTKMNFIIIDDSKVDRFIAEKVIQSSGLSKSCHAFQQAADALEHISKKEHQDIVTVVFVDEHMPFMNGMDFVKSFAELKIINKERYHIYILSSSMRASRPAATEHAYVKKFLNKPLMKRTIHELFHDDLKCVPHE